jgi:hypothetical protein
VGQNRFQVEGGKLKKPTKIFLQWYGDTEMADLEHLDESYPDLEQVCWCDEKCFESDLGPYVLEDQSEIVKLRKRIEELENIIRKSLAQ